MNKHRGNSVGQAKGQVIADDFPPTRVATSGVWKNTRSIQVPNPRYLQICSTGMYRVIPETIGWFHPAEGRSGFPLVPHHPGCRGRSPEGRTRIRWKLEKSEPKCSLQWGNITIRPSVDGLPIETGDFSWPHRIRLQNAVRSLLQSYPPVSLNVASWQIPN